MGEFAISAWGVSARVCWDAPEWDERLLSLKLPIWGEEVDPESCQSTFRLTIVDGEPHIEGPEGTSDLYTTKGGVLETLERRLHMHLATHAQEAIYVHSGVVIVNQRALLFPGRSWAGKTTLVHELATRGCEILSDEYAIIDRQGRVYPFPRPMALRDRSGSGSERLPLETLTWQANLASRPAGAVLDLSYHPGGAAIDLKAASTGAAVLALMENTVSARLQPRLALECSTQIAKQARFWSGKRGEVEVAASALLAMNLFDSP